MNNDNRALNIDEYMDDELRVVDRDRRRIGTVVAHERDLGYMLIRPHPLSERIYYVPFSTITHIDPREVFVSRTRKEVHQLYRDPPSRSTFLKERHDPVTGEDDSEAITIEPSGYDGTPLVVDDVPVDEVAHQIEPGFQVLSSELEDLGTIADDAPPRGQMLIRSHFPSRHVQMLSTAFLDFVDREDRAVYLAVSAADLRRVPAVVVEKESESPVGAHEEQTL